MNSSITPVPLRALRKHLAVCTLLLGFAWCSSSSSAHVAQATRFVGFVQTIDYKSKTFTFQSVPAGAPLNLGWNLTTEFLADDKRIPADALKVGVRVKVKYISVLFGRKYATKVEWTTAVNPAVSQPASASHSSAAVSSQQVVRHG